MLATSDYSRLPNSTYPKLGDLHLSLFGERMAHEHNAEFDVMATANCFFKLLEKGDIDQSSIKLQSKTRDKTKSKVHDSGCGLQVLAISLLLALIYWL